jgi:hypothetical protein
MKIMGKKTDISHVEIDIAPMSVFEELRGVAYRELNIPVGAFVSSDRELCVEDEIITSHTSYYVRKLINVTSQQIKAVNAFNDIEGILRGLKEV